MKRLRIAITGGIACGKSLVTQFLGEMGVETLDADDVVHELVPEDERRKLAKIVFKDAEARARLCARIHPLVRTRLDDFLDQGSEKIRMAVIPLLFETHWEKNFDIVCAVVSRRETQVARMMETRGYTREEAEDRMAAQMPAEEKAARADFVIENNGTAGELKSNTKRFVEWISQKS